MRQRIVSGKGIVFGTILAAASIVPGWAMQPFGPAPQSAPRVVRATTMTMGGSYLGVGVLEIDSERAKTLKLKDESGVEITRIEDDSPAAKAGLKVGDVILEYHGQRVEGIEQFSRLVRETPAGREVKLQIVRDGNPQMVLAKVGGRKAPYAITIPRIELPEIASLPDMPRSLMMWRSTMLGIEGESLRGQLAEYFGVKDGVLVRSVMKDSPAAKAGLKAGDVIVKVDDSKVSSPSEITGVIRRLREKKSIPLLLMRDHKEVTVTATIEEDRSEWNLFEIHPAEGAPANMIRM